MTQRTPATTQLTTDDLFKTLSNRRRRYVLHYMKRYGDDRDVPIRTLSEQIAAWENGVDSTAVNPKQRKRIYTALHQTHLPRMDRLGIVKYDQNRGTVSMGGSLNEFDIYFQLLRDNELPWSHVYLGLGSVTTALMVCVALAIPPFAAVSPLVYASLLSVLLVVVGGYHTVVERQGILGAAKAPPEMTFQQRESPEDGRAVASTGDD